MKYSDCRSGQHILNCRDRGRSRNKHGLLTDVLRRLNVVVHEESVSALNVEVGAMNNGGHGPPGSDEGPAAASSNRSRRRNNKGTTAQDVDGTVVNSR